MINVKNYGMVINAVKDIKITDIFDFSKSAEKYLIINACNQESNIYGYFTYNNGTKITPSPFPNNIKSSSIVYTYSNGAYYNSTYGYLTNLKFHTSDAKNNLSVLTVGVSNTFNPSYSMSLDFVSTYLNSLNLTQYSASIATQPDYINNSKNIVDVAKSFVGKTWSIDNYWSLMDTIATINKTSLPLMSINYNAKMVGNGDWVLKYDGNNPRGDWKNLINVGDIVFLHNDSGYGGGAICVSGSGKNAMVIDNAVGKNNIIDNNTIKILEPHLLSTVDVYKFASSDMVYIFSLKKSVVVPTTAVVNTSVPNPVLYPSDTSNSQYTVNGIKVNPPPDLKYGINQLVLYKLTNIFSMPNKAVKMTIENLPSWLKYDGYSLKGLTPNVNSDTQLIIKGEYNGKTVYDYMKLVVDKTVSNDISSVTWVVGKNNTLSLLKSNYDKFYITDDNKVGLTWLRIDQNTGTLSGIPPDKLVGQSLHLTAYQQGAVYEPKHDIDSFTIDIVGVNNFS
jgi:predicted outer membrane repeat protein